MRVCLNGLDYYPGELGGVEVYFQNLLAHLPGASGDVESIIVVGHTENRSALPRPTPKRENRILAYGRPTLGWALRKAILRGCALDILGPYFEQLGVDLVHHPFTMMSPLRLRVPTVLTFHDMQDEYLPEMFSERERRSRRERYRHSVARATRIIAISSHVRRSLLEMYGAGEDRVDLVLQGCDPLFRPLGNEPRRADLLRKHGLSRPFLLYPAATWRHKNHERLLQAIRTLQDLGRFDGELVLTGLAMDHEEQVSREVARLRLRGTVRRLGFVAPEELLVMYNEARALVFPSLFEGFGIPLVEAMACGCPIACSRETSLPEVAGEAAVYCDPRSVESIADAIYTVWQDEARRASLRVAGFRRAAQLTWQRAATETVDVYRRALA